MTAQELYQIGRIDEAMEALGATLRADPADVRARTFLFELLCFAGQYDRAAKQLAVIAGTSQEARLGALLYGHALNGERARGDMFESGAVGRAPPAPQVSGTLNQRPFSSICDADPRIGGRLEFFAAGQYTWIPFEHLAELRLETPKLLRDLLWAPGRVQAGPRLKDFDFGEVLVPAVAPLSWRHSDWEVRFGRTVAWEPGLDGFDVPLGAKMLLVDGEPVPILDARVLVITPTEAS